MPVFPQCPPYPQHLLSMFQRVILYSSVVCLPVVPGQQAAVSPAGRRGILQAAQFDRHLLQGSSLGFTLTGDQFSLEDTEQDIEASGHDFEIHDFISFHLFMLADSLCFLLLICCILLEQPVQPKQKPW